tara:strand:+ start:9654 stop:10100 length:447 start_codon:yes stop_codon:yes gene_type:complete
MSETLLEKLDRIESELKKIRSMKPPKPIDYSEGISILEGINKELSKKLLDITDKYESLNKEIAVLKNKKPVTQVDYSIDILALSKRVDKLIADNKPVKHVDHNKELPLINNEIASIKQSLNKKQDIDIKSEVEKVVTIAYVTNLYRNK